MPIVFDNAKGHDIQNLRINYVAVPSLASNSGKEKDGWNEASAMGPVIQSSPCRGQRFQKRAQLSPNSSKETIPLDVSDHRRGEERWNASTEEQRTKDSRLTSPPRPKLQKRVKGPNFEDIPPPRDYTSVKQLDPVIRKRVSPPTRTRRTRRISSDRTGVRCSLMKVNWSVSPSASESLNEAIEIVRTSRGAHTTTYGEESC